MVRTLRCHCREPRFNPFLGNEDPASWVGWPKKKNHIKEDSMMIDMHIYCEMITIIKLIHTSITSHSDVCVCTCVCVCVCVCVMGMLKTTLLANFKLKYSIIK